VGRTRRPGKKTNGHQGKLLAGVNPGARLVSFGRQPASWRRSDLISHRRGPVTAGIETPAFRLSFYTPLGGSYKYVSGPLDWLRIASRARD